MTIQEKIASVHPAADEPCARSVAVLKAFDALMECDRRDRVPLLEQLILMLRPGQPIAAFSNVSAEAAYWADLASDTELRAYTLASYMRLSKKDQSDFIEYAQDGASA